MDQASEPDVAETLELSNREFKTTTINILVTLMNKVDQQCVQRNANFKKEEKRKARD